MTQPEFDQSAIDRYNASAQRGMVQQQPESTEPAKTWGMPKGKSGVLAGVLQLVLPIGIGRFYLGDNLIGAVQLITAPVGLGLLWCWFDGIGLIFGAGPRRN